MGGRFRPGQWASHPRSPIRNSKRGGGLYPKTGNVARRVPGEDWIFGTECHRLSRSLARP